MGSALSTLRGNIRRRAESLPTSIEELPAPLNNPKYAAAAGATALAGSFALGALSMYGILLARGHAPLYFGFEHWGWSRRFWVGKKLLDELPRQGFVLHPFQESTRNFLNVHQSTEERRIRKIYYYSETDKRLVGFGHFGADCEGPPLHVHGGAMAAFIDASVAIAAIRITWGGNVTAHLDINYRKMVPLGTNVVIDVQYDEDASNLRKTVLSYAVLSVPTDGELWVDEDEDYEKRGIVTYVTGSAVFATKGTNALELHDTFVVRPARALRSPWRRRRRMRRKDRAAAREAIRQGAKQVTDEADFDLEQDGFVRSKL